MVLTKIGRVNIKETAQIYWQHKREGMQPHLQKQKPLFNLEVSAEMSLL